jgi:hypothetical protein
MIVWMLGCTVRLSPEGEPGEAAKLEEGESLELTWHAVSTTAHPPCEEGLAVYDEARQQIVYVGAGSVLQMPWAPCRSTWSYDGTDWTEVADDAHSPPWRIDAALGYDPVRQRVVLFGGQLLQGGTGLTRQVWEWDGNSWSERTPPSSTLQPEPVREPGLQFDPESGRLLMFGGSTAQGAPSGTWAWDGAAWTRLASGGPWHLPHATWDGEALVGLGNGTPGFGGWELLTWSGSGWTEEPAPFVGAQWLVHDPSPGVTLLSAHPSEVYWRGPDGIELRTPTGDPLPDASWHSSIFVYDPHRDRTVSWNVGYGDVVMELEAQAIADVPPELVSPPDELQFDVGFRTSHLVSARAPDGDPLTLRLEDLPATPWPLLEAYPPTDWALSWEPAPEQVGEHEVTLVLSDGVSEVRHPVRLVVGLRDLAGFPHGQFVSSGSGTARIGEQGSTITHEVGIQCTLTVDNPGTAELGCSASFPFWVERSNDYDLHVPSYTLVDHASLGSANQPFVFEEWGVSSSPTPLHDDPWTWAYGSIAEIPEGYRVTVGPQLPSGLETERGVLDEALVTIESAEIVLGAPRPLLVTELVPGDLVITEIMRNPAQVSDATGEWLELYNASGSDVELHGLQISDADFDHHVIASSLVVPAAAYVVLTVEGDTTLNGGVVPSYVLDDVVLANGADELYLGVGATVLDAVEWGTGWPAPNGASMSLSAGESASTNDDPAQWCSGTTAYGSGDRGSPGAPNPGC